MSNMKYKKLIILLIIVAIVAFLGCSNGRKKISLIEIDDNFIGAVSADDKDVFYASYDQEAADLFPSRTWIKKSPIAKDGEPEVIYEFKKANNISYLKSIKHKLVLVIDDLKTDKICIFERGELNEVGEAPVGKINPSYSGEILTWLDSKKGEIYKLDLDSKEIITVDAKNLAMNQYERAFNFENKTYFFEYQDDNKEILNLVALDWTTKETEVIIAGVQESGELKEKPSNIKVNASYIIWQKNSRSDSLLFVYDREQETLKSYSQDDFGGFIKHTSLIDYRVYVFDESGDYGIEVLDLKKESVTDIADIGELKKDATHFIPVFPYWTKKGFISTGVIDQQRRLFIIVEGR